MIGSACLPGGQAITFRPEPCLNFIDKSETNDVLLFSQLTACSYPSNGPSTHYTEIVKKHNRCPSYLSKT